MLSAGQGGVRVHSRAAPLGTLGTGLEAGRPVGASGVFQRPGKGLGWRGALTHESAPGLKSLVKDDDGDGYQKVKHLG